MDQPLSAAHKLIKSHLISGAMTPGKEIGLKIDHVLQQDATGTLVMLELEAIGSVDTQAEVAVQYVDHNLLQTDFKNADDHLFLQSAAKKFGYWYSRPGNGISHAVHMERFGVPGKSLLGSDSHTCAGGGLGMLAIGTGGLDVALAAVGKPYYVKMPKIMGIKLTGSLPEWVSAKDVVLEMLRRYDVKGGRDFILEYYGPGVKELSAWDRHVIANMGTELGATATVFPSDERTKFFMESEGRGDQWQELKADEGATYDAADEINLSELVPLIACPSSPGKVVPVSEVAGKPVSQVVIGSSANPGFRDFWVVSEIIKDKEVNPELSLDINPSTRQVIQNLTAKGALANLIQSGARFHQTGCMGCIGMGQAPASGKISLRTMPRNFPGRSGTDDDQVYLCSPETAAAAALTGEITDPRDLAKKYAMNYPSYQEAKEVIINTQMLIPPAQEGEKVELTKGPNIKSIPEFPQLEDKVKVPVILKMGDNISTDEILKAGTEVLPLRSNIPEISKYAYQVVDKQFHEKSIKAKEKYTGHIVIGGENYAQGSSREHAALAPRFLGQKAVIAKSYARIGWQNLINFGIVPFEFKNPSDYDSIEENDVIVIEGLREAIKNNKPVVAKNETKNKEIELTYNISSRQQDVILKGGVINFLKSNL
ncbi:aconitate hydratase [Fulvivirga sediminis]|uniref:Aconitate hydratase n=1 Tax=Fulvivirga sediminis TaxID=2803949 RepID=A0A937F5C3_9BACT|nr:aconitate hydratase [Fulvivirga sediminis]MBL3655222.1 aconitate hydratase [Fulvivirga sediminis]